MRRNAVLASALLLGSLTSPVQANPVPAPPTVVISQAVDPALTRLEFIKALLPFIQEWETRGLIKPLPGSSINVFIDLEGADREAMLRLSDRYMLFAGAFEQAGVFGGELPIRRREAGLILSGLLDHAPSGKTPPSATAGALRTFDDLGPETHQRMRHALRAELLIGFPDGTFRPGRPLTRAQWEQVASKLDAWAARAPRSTPAVMPAPPKAPEATRN